MPPILHDLVGIQAGGKDFLYSRPQLVVNMLEEAGRSVLVQQCSTSGWAAVDQWAVVPHHQYWPVDLMAVDLMAVDLMAGALMAVDLMAVDLMAVDLMAVDLMAGDLMAGDQHSVAHLPQSHRAEGLLFQHECIFDCVIT